MIENWKFTEPSFEPEGGLDFGSGYPSDPKCKAWMEKNLADPVFCFPDFCRFSWGPAKKAVEDGGGIRMEWEGDEEEEEKKSESEDLKRQQLQMQAFVGGLSKEKVAKKRKRSAYFENTGLRSIATLHHG